MNKIEALKKTIYNLENDVYDYRWHDADSCNCGILARTILGGKTARQCGLNDSPLRANHGGFGRFAYCMVSDLPIPEVFQALKDTGFSYQEIVELEMLGNMEILNRIQAGSYFNEDQQIYVINNLKYSDKETVIKYLKAWVEILEEKDIDTGAKIETPEPKPEKKKVVYVVVDSPVRDLVKQILEKESN